MATRQAYTQVSNNKKSPSTNTNNHSNTNSKHKNKQGNATRNAHNMQVRKIMHHSMDISLGVSKPNNPVPPSSPPKLQFYFMERKETECEKTNKKAARTRRKQKEQMQRKIGRLLQEKPDFVILLDSGAFPLHRAVLSFRSPYFTELFTKESLTRMSLPSVDPESFQTIKDYIYEGKLSISSDNITCIYALSELFMLDEAIASCHSWLDKQATKRGVFKVVYKAARRKNVPKLYESSLRWLEQRSGKENVFERAGAFFYKLSGPVLAQIFERKRMIMSELDKFLVAIDWANNKASKYDSDSEIEFEDRKLRFLRQPLRGINLSKLTYRQIFTELELTHFLSPEKVFKICSDKVKVEAPPSFEGTITASTEITVPKETLPKLKTGAKFRSERFKYGGYTWSLLMHLKEKHNCLVFYLALDDPLPAHASLNMGQGGFVLLNRDRDLSVKQRFGSGVVFTDDRRCWGLSLKTVPIYKLMDPNEGWLIGDHVFILVRFPTSMNLHNSPIT